jgi:hypothetical protein
MEKNLFIFILVSLIFSGCASLPSAYKTPPVSATTQERQQIYDEHYVSNNWLGMRQIGGRVARTSIFSFSNYFRDSGYPPSVALVHRSEDMIWVGTAAGLGGLLVGSMLTPETRAANPNAYLITVSSGLVSDMLILIFGYGHYFDAAADSFNTYLKRDLGLPEDYQPKVSQ